MCNPATSTAVTGVFAIALQQRLLMIGEVPKGQNLAPGLMWRCGHVGYVEQFDTLLAELTVREMLLYTAELKCSLAESLAKKKRRVDSLLETLALDRCANTLIGDSLARGISGGQVSAPAPAPCCTLHE